MFAKRYQSLFVLSGLVAARMIFVQICFCSVWLSSIVDWLVRKVTFLFFPSYPLFTHNAAQSDPLLLLHSCTVRKGSLGKEYGHA